MRTVIRLILASFLAATPLLAGVDARMLRQPDVSSTQIAFVYAGDIWTVPKAGGTAYRLSTPAGEEAFPRFSPDGESIAFSGNYDGNQDVYVIPAGGGLPVRVTHHPMPDRLLDWYPDGGSLLYASGMTAGRNRFNQLYKTSKDGGLPERLPVPYGEFGTVSPDGKTLAYLPATRDFRTWKRYRGGLTTDIWLFDLEDYSAEILADSDTNDTQPMWHGSQIYFLSDRGEHRRFNIWTATAGGDARQVTHFEKYDIHFPAIGPEDLVFENAGRLYRLDLATEELHEVEVEVVTDLETLKPRVEQVQELILNYDVSPSGKRAVFEARGDVFTVPAKHGIVRNLTRSSGSAERSPTWSPDGEQIAYLSDRSGEYEITVRAADGSGEEKTLTALGPGFRYQLVWSPDSKKIAFVDQAMNIRYYDLDKDQVVDVDKALYLFEGTLRSFHFDWSPDSRWLAYHRGLEKLGSAVFLYDTAAGIRHQVTSGYYPARNPVFDPEGKYLYIYWDRTFVPSYSDFQNSWIYANSTHIAAVPLRADVASPLAARNDEEEDEDKGDKDKEEDGKKDGGEPKGKKDKKGKGKDEDGDEAKAKDEDKKPEPVEIDVEGFESRIVVLPPEPGNYNRLAAVKGKVIYHRMPRTGAADGPFGGREGDVVYYDLEEREEKTVIAGVGDFRVAAGGEKILVNKNSSFAILDVKPEQKMEDKLAVAGMEMTVDPAAEWRQIFNDAWRFERDYFYDPNLHGVDWQAMRERYGELLDAAVTRWDVNYVIGELIGELNSSHAYRGGGDTETEKRRGVGLLGADFAIDGGAYRFASIVELPSWETEVRSPLREPGVKVAEGDYLLAVNGVAVDTSKDPWAAFEGLAGQAVMLTVNDKPSMDGAREVLVETLEDEERLRNLAWIEANRRRVEEASGGRVGYVYVPSTGRDGQSELVRQFLGALDTEGLIVDERFNSGGQIPDRFIELLNRPLLNYWAVRDGLDWEWPPSAHRGPKAMLINGWSGSGGDLFPFYFKSAGLGPLVGTRTWGGLIGVSGAPPLIDGGGVTVPTFAIYGTDGKWIIEGHGVEPDIEVIDDPSAMAKGGDPQLERAVEEVLKALDENPPRRPGRPAYEDRSGS